ncbi:MAG TPA: hypothetical protein PK407_09100 [Verrucomicrobiota bacterium]|nr:hypothetical protein [Verrucomicrobiota bacterium]HPW80928.1 hypothetical protein [Verrucomicrobiota bacterium]
MKHFFGTGDSAVKTQVWIAICVYVLVAITRWNSTSTRACPQSCRF